MAPRKKTIQMLVTYYYKMSEYTNPKCNILNQMSGTPLPYKNKFKYFGDAWYQKFRGIRLRIRLTID